MSLSGGTSRQSTNQTQTNTLSDRAAGLLTGQANDLRGQSYRELDPAAIARFQNPYQQDVVNATMGQIGQDRSVAFNQLDDRLARSGAFGDKRRGIQEAEVAGQFDRTTAQTLAGLNSANYGQALGVAQGENQAANNYGLNIQQLIAALNGQFANEGTTTGRGTTRGSQFGFSFQPRFGPGG